MDYYINPAVLTSAFMLPSVVVDKHLKFAKAEHLKVLLYIMRYMSADVETETVVEATGLDEYEVGEALLYWADAGVLLPKQEIPQKEEVRAVAKRQQKPNRQDVARRGLEDPKIRFLLRETQLKLGRNLKSNETSTLVWLYDDEGLEVSLILLIVQYAVAHNKSNISFIESIAVDWIKKGINDITAADEELKKMAASEQAWSIVSAAFGLEKRKASPKELETSLMWIDEWQLSREMLECAYAKCVDTKSKFSFAYTKKIIEEWHEKGYKKPADIEEKKTDKKESFAAYDMDLFEKMLSSKD